MKAFEIFEDEKQAREFAKRVDGMVYEVSQMGKTYYKVSYYAD